MNNNLLEKWQDLATVHIPPLESKGFTENVLHRDIWDQPKKTEEPQKLPQEPVFKMDPDLNAKAQDVSPESELIPKPEAAVDMTEEILTQNEPGLQECSALEDETTLLTLPEEIDEDQTVLLCAEEPRDIPEPEPEERAYIIRANTNERIDVDQDPFILGKSEKADYQIHGNNAISRKHIEISKTEDGYQLEDLNSSNHTYIDGKKVTKREPLKDGQTFQLADEEFCFFIETV